MHIYLPSPEIHDDVFIPVTGSLAHYLISVVRIQEGNDFTVIDGKGNAYHAFLSSISGKGKNRTAFVRIGNPLPVAPEYPFDSCLCPALLKGEKMDLVVQKATELGVKEIRPFIAERCVVRMTRKTSRWNKIAQEAAEQCERAFIPVVNEPVPFPELLDGIEKRGRGILFRERGGMDLKHAVSEILSGSGGKGDFLPVYFLVIGPEGGFTRSEIAAACTSGLIETSLGRRILRAETASITALTLVHFLIENSCSLPGIVQDFQNC